MNGLNTTGMWYMELDDGKVISIQHGNEESGSPLENIDDFDDGDYWIIDMGNDTRLEDEYPIYERDDSFCKVPKDEVVNVFFEEYKPGSEPKPIKSTNIFDVISNKFGL